MDPYCYELPEGRIAQRPVKPYDRAKMLLCSRGAKSIEDSCFQEIAQYFHQGDLLVFNDTKVIPARFFARNCNTSAEVEILLLESGEGNCWEVLAKPLRKLRKGEKFHIHDSELYFQVREDTAARSRQVKFFKSNQEEVSPEELFAAGLMPIPPYIRDGYSDEADFEDYQTHFASKEGSVAAPTASLHFTPELMAEIEGRGVRKEFLTLHVGAASFLPLWKPGEELQQPGEERMFYLQRVVDAIKETRERGKRVFAVGTTAVRALETMMRREAADGEELRTDLFIQPGFEFKAIDGMVTNFHQPGTTHLLLVEAFLGRELLNRAYQHALAGDYRFLSYGDGMLLSP